jgi:ketosteroid isomerase-like protein
VTAEDNVAMIRRGFAGFNRGDFEAGVAEMAPDIEWHMAFRLPDLPRDKRIYRGTAEVRQLWGAFWSAWKQLTVNLEDVIHADDEVVIARARFVGEGGTSGIEVDRTLFYVFEFAGGMLRRLRPFDTESDALAAAGQEVPASS